jgi:hypothetical protein
MDECLLYCSENDEFLSVMKCEFQMNGVALLLGTSTATVFDQETVLSVACLCHLTLLNVAVTDLLASIVTVQGLVPVQPPPLQPVKVEFLFCGVAVSVTIVPLV